MEGSSRMLGEAPGTSSGGEDRGGGELVGIAGGGGLRDG
jgi:hypothetical protein